MKNQGISLITLIITIIVIIILAAIVIFTGLRTPDSAQFSAFTNDVDTVYTAMVDKFADLKVAHSMSGEYRTNEQIYLEIATGKDQGQYAIMNVDSVTNAGTSASTSIPLHGTATSPDNTTKCQLINNGNANYPDGSTFYATTGYGTSSNKFGLTITLPKVRQTNESWYVTSDGRIFNSTGYTYNGNTYYNATYYTAGKEVRTNHIEDRAKKICGQMFSSANNAFEVTLNDNES